MLLLCIQLSVNGRVLRVFEDQVLWRLNLNQTHTYALRRQLILLSYFCGVEQVFSFLYLPWDKHQPAAETKCKNKRVWKCSAKINATCSSTCKFKSFVLFWFSECRIWFASASEPSITVTVYWVTSSDGNQTQRGIIMSEALLFMGQNTHENNCLLVKILIFCIPGIK